MSETKTVWTQDVVGGQFRVLTFEPTVESLDAVITGLKWSIEHANQPGFVDPNTGVTLLLAELLKQALEKKACS